MTWPRPRFARRSCRFETAVPHWTWRPTLETYAKGISNDSWKAPLMGWMKLNFVRSCDYINKDNAVIAGLSRGHHGIVQMSYASQMRVRGRDACTITGLAIM